MALREFALAALLAACADPVPFPDEAVVVANGGDGTLTVIDAKTEQVVGTLSLDEDLTPHHINVSPSRKRLVVSAFSASAEHAHGGGEEGATSTLFFVDPVLGEVADDLPVEGTAHNGVFASDGTLLAHAVKETNKLRLVQSDTGIEVAAIDVGAGPLEVTLSADEQRAFVANGAGNSVTVVDLGSRSASKTVDVGTAPIGAWPGADGKFYVTNEKSNDVTVLDQSGAVVTRIDVGGRPGQAATRPDGKLLYVANEENQRVQVFTIPGYTLRASIEAGQKPHGIAFSADGAKAYVTDEGAGKLLVVSTSEEKVVGTIAVGSAPNGVAFWRKP